MPKLSICIFTYNHEKYLAEALDSVLSQKVNFEYEVIIGEDYSSDSTLQVAQSYQARYPQFIRIERSGRKEKLIINGHQTGRFNFLNVLSLCKGKYIALLDGDDYWIDEYKLQKQIDFLDSHEQYSFCFHNVYLESRDGNNIQRDRTFHGKSFPSTGTVLEIELVKSNLAPTSSVVFRNNIPAKFPGILYTSVFGDWPLHIFNLNFGRAKYFSEVMGVYRIGSGLWTQKPRVDQLKAVVDFYSLVPEILPSVLHKKIPGALAIHCEALARALISNGEYAQGLMVIVKYIRNERFLSLIRRVRAMVKSRLYSFIIDRFPIPVICRIQSLGSRGELKRGRRTYIHPSVQIIGKANVIIGNNSSIGQDSWINVNHRIIGSTGVEIGNHCFIGRRNFFSSGKKITLGDYTLTTVDCKFICSSHIITNPAVPYIASGTTSNESIRIGVNCFFGVGSMVQGDVNIGHGSIIGSGSVVTHSIPPFSIVIGAPARITKRYSFSKKEWLNVNEAKDEDFGGNPDENTYLKMLNTAAPNPIMPWIVAGADLGNL